MYFVTVAYSLLAASYLIELILVYIYIYYLLTRKQFKNVLQNQMHCFLFKLFWEIDIKSWNLWLVSLNWWMVGKYLLNYLLTMEETVLACPVFLFYCRSFFGTFSFCARACGWFNFAKNGKKWTDLEVRELDCQELYNSVQESLWIWTLPFQTKNHQNELKFLLTDFVLSGSLSHTHILEKSRKIFVTMSGLRLSQI